MTEWTLIREITQTGHTVLIHVSGDSLFAVVRNGMKAGCVPATPEGLSEALRKIRKEK